jgi:hypothetical protein
MMVYNRATRVLATTLGVLVGVGSIDHGLLECMQGYHPTPGLIVNALGPGYQWTAWHEGGEAAITLLPNFLLTGIVASLHGMLMIIWSVRCIHGHYGPFVFLTLGVASFLTGGGVAQIVLIILTWALATRIRTSLAFWRLLIPQVAWPALGRVWPWSLAVSIALLVIALGIAIFGYIPGVSDHTHILHICWNILGIALILLFISIFSAFAEDLSNRIPCPGPSAFKK